MVSPQQTTVCYRSCDSRNHQGPIVEIEHDGELYRETHVSIANLEVICGTWCAFLREDDPIQSDLALIPINRDKLGKHPKDGGPFCFCAVFRMLHGFKHITRSKTVLSALQRHEYIRGSSIIINHLFIYERH